MRRFAAILFFFMASQAWGQEPVPLEVKGDVEFVKITRLVPVTEDREIVKKLPFDVLAPKDADGYWWTLPPGVVANDKGDTLEITSAPNGELVVKVKVQTITFDIDFEKKTTKKKTVFTFGSRTLNIGTITPPLPPPIPPTPPTPPPVPPPPPAPIPTAGFRVLIVLESSDLSKLPASQVSIITAKPIRDYLELRCVKGSDGTPERRIWDKDVSTANVSKIWQEAMALPRTSLPWIVISNGVAGFSGPLPPTVNETLELLKKYGGV